MTLDLPAYTFVDGKTPLSAASLNDRFYSIVRRLHALETVVIDWDAAISTVQDKGLQLINDVYRPLYNELSSQLCSLIDQGETSLAQWEEQMTLLLQTVEGRIAQVENSLAIMAQSVSEVSTAQSEIDSRITQLKSDLAAGIAQAKLRALIF